MKQFLIRTGMLLLVAAAIFLVSAYFMQRSTMSTAKRYLFETNKDAVCLITGTSHSWHGLDPRLFPFKTINIAEPGKPVLIDIQLLEKHIAEFHDLKYVIIPIDYFTLYFEGDQDEFSQRYYFHWNLKPEYKPIPVNHQYHILTCGISPAEMFGGFKSDPLLGFRPLHTDFSQKSELARKKDAIHRVGEWNKKWTGSSNAMYIVKRIKELAELLKSRGIAPVFVSMPLSEEAIASLDKDEMAANAQMIEDIVNTSHSTYIDLQTDQGFKADSLFDDCDHLNTDGATYATGILKNCLSRNIQLTSMLSHRNTK